MTGRPTRLMGDHKIGFYVLAVIASILVTCVVITVLIATNLASQVRQSQIAGEYHLNTTVHIAAAEYHLLQITRAIALQESLNGEAGPDNDFIQSVINSRAVLTREIQAIQDLQDAFAEARFEPVLQRVTDAYTDVAGALDRAQEQPGSELSGLLTRLNLLQQRLDQLKSLHLSAYESRADASAQLKDWSRLYVLSSLVALAGLILIALFIWRIRLSILAQRRLEQRQRIMLSELDHRVKNNLATLQGLARQSMKSAATPEAFFNSLLARTRAMAASHDFLRESGFDAIHVDEAVSVVLAPYAAEQPDRIHAAGEEVRLTARAATSLCMALNELAMNAQKHGALSPAEGSVDVSWTLKDNRFEVTWTERGGPALESAPTPGSGMKLIEGFVRFELKGDLGFDFNRDGLVCRFSIPLQQLSVA